MFPMFYLGQQKKIFTVDKCRYVDFYSNVSVQYNCQNSVMTTMFSLLRERFFNDWENKGEKPLYSNVSVQYACQNSVMTTMFSLLRERIFIDWEHNGENPPPLPVGGGYRRKFEKLWFG